MIEFLIVATGYNCSKYTEACIDSIMAQTYKNFKFMMVDDCSTDGNSILLNRLLENNTKGGWLYSDKNRGAAYCRHRAVEFTKPKDETVIVLIGMDDVLLPNCLERIAEEYEKGAWMTYGNWIDTEGYKLPPDFPLDFPQSVHDNRSYRKETYRSTAPNTFKAFLFKAIPADDFKINGKWIDSATEAEVMFSCLEMSGQSRINIIDEVLCVYTRHNKNVFHRLGTGYKYKLLDIIRKRPKRNLIIRE